MSPLQKYKHKEEKHVAVFVPLVSVACILCSSMKGDDKFKTSLPDLPSASVSDTAL
jgi:hypothetical protein